jgi:hypothetical protein
MPHSIWDAVLRAIPVAQSMSALVELLVPLWKELAEKLHAFRCGAITPLATYELEQAVQASLREQGRLLLHWLLNQVESPVPEENPRRVVWQGEGYRRRQQHPRRVATLFGSITLRRFLYEPLERGERSMHPVELRLGIEAGCATPALAERVGWWSAQQPQRVVRAILRRDHGVAWSHSTLRKVTQSLSAGLTAWRHEAQVDKVVHWLRHAFASRGPHRPVLSVGRDGVHVPLREDKVPEYAEGAVATVAVFNRRGQRLGTVYLGRMPEAKQVTLSQQLTALLEDVLRRWTGPVPRLAYVTDAGWHPTDYFRRVLRRWQHPGRPGVRLVWERILDFYHACTYLTKLADALFGASGVGQVWGRRMRKLLKQQRGLTRVLQSASYQANQRTLPAAREEEFAKAYRYLRKRGRLMDYRRYRRQGLPLGSGVTEAACKTVFTQRLKQSGMGWKIPSGQVIVDLRVLLLSDVWTEVHRSYLTSKALTRIDTLGGAAKKTGQRAA